MGPAENVTIFGAVNIYYKSLAAYRTTYFM